ncbi:MAG TPA: DNA recombination protein RmuC [Acidimicrobiales bacterium]|nr:DNA recombination protein RmuC [Acidimicrobiales bacterium]
MNLPIALALILVAAAVVVVGMLGRERRLARRVVAEFALHRHDDQAVIVDSVIAVANERLGAHRAMESGAFGANRALIDRELAEVRGELSRMTELVRSLERDREQKFGDLAGQLRLSGEQTAALAETTRQLRQALSSTKARGQWGERMADDVLRLAGMIDGVNYRKQRGIEGGGVPDFTFLLPAGQVCYMDVKFPLDNYLRFVEAEVDLDRQRHKKAFLRDVRQRVAELAERDYSAGEDAVDVVLLFIPNEQLSCFIQEHDAGVLDEAIRRNIVLCSPLTLFAVLAVIRQAADNFVLEQRSKEVLGLLGGFSRQWGDFVDQMDKLGRRLDGAQRDYESLVGTRRRQLECHLDRIDELRLRRGPPVDGAVAAAD